MKKIKIGLIGESPHDTKAIKNLLNQSLKEKVSFFEMVKNVRGSNLDDRRTKHFLRKNFELKQPDLVIFIRDLDALENDAKLLKQRKRYFSEFNSVVDKKGIYLLNIFEIEALILSDIESFNKYYKIDVNFTSNPMEQEEPKEFLRSNSKYKESDCPDLFKYLNINEIKNNCSYFNLFLDKFYTQIS